MGAALRGHCLNSGERFGYRPLLAESFIDPEAYEGTCYKLAIREAVGYSALIATGPISTSPMIVQKLWLRPLCSEARQWLRSAELPADCRGGLGRAPSGTLPVSEPQMSSLFELFRKAPDPRGRNTRYRIGPVLTLIALALLAGRREIAEIASLSTTTLTQRQRRNLWLPRKKEPRHSLCSRLQRVLTRRSGV